MHKNILQLALITCFTITMATSAAQNPMSPERNELANFTTRCIRDTPQSKQSGLDWYTAEYSPYIKYTFAGDGKTKDAIISTFINPEKKYFVDISFLIGEESTLEALQRKLHDSQAEFPGFEIIHRHKNDLFIGFLSFSEEASSYKEINEIVKIIIKKFQLFPYEVNINLADNSAVKTSSLPRNISINSAETTFPDTNSDQSATSTSSLLLPNSRKRKFSSINNNPKEINKNNAPRGNKRKIKKTSHIEGQQNLLQFFPKLG